MDCPCCRAPMIVLELHAVEVDHCLSCSGIWLDAGELELLLDGPSARETLLDSFRPEPSPGEGRRKCPICRKTMPKVSCGSEKRVLIDRCRKGHGLWFDRGELREIIEACGFNEDGKVLHLLQEIFGEVP